MIIELPKRVGGTDVEYLQQQINSMKNQLENAYGTGGGSITVEEIKAMNLEVGKQIKMGPNAVISWLQVTDNEDVASVEATQKKIDEVNTMLSERITAVNNSIPSDYVPYDPYQTYIDGHMVITEVVAAQNLLIEGGTVRIKSGANDNYLELTDTSGERTVYLSPDMMTMWGPNGGVQISGGAIHVGSSMNSMVKIEDGGVLTVGGSQVATKSDLSSYYKKGSTAEFYKTYVTSPGAISDSNSVLRWYSENGQICTTSSSRRWKRDIEDVMDESLDPHKLYDIHVRQFRYNEGTLVDGKDDVLRIGFIAEEMDEIYPLGACYDSDGTPRDWNERALIPAMLKLIQEQNERIKVLEEKLA